MPIAEQALHAVCDRTSLFMFLRDQLSWPVDPEDTFMYEGPRLHGEVAARAEVNQIVPFTTGDPYTIMLAEFKTPFRRADLRAILQKMREEIRKRAKYGGRKLDEIIFVCATENYGGVRFLRFEERAGRQPKLSAFGWDCRHREGTRTLRDINLPALKMPPQTVLGVPDWNQAHWSDAWNVEKITGEFYRQYRIVFHDLMAQIRDVRGNARLFTQRLCNRLLFIQFLAKKEWLNRDRNYLRTLWELAGEHAAKPGISAAKRANFYSDFLHSLFFRALNTPTNSRPADADWSALSAMLGDVPFLNGGLFARQDADDDPGAVVIPNDAFAPMLDLFDRFNFTLTESTPDDVEVAVDAEMLGKVFEELVNEDERHSTGSYYTPRGIVSYMCREAVKGYLGGGDAVAKFVDKGDPSDLHDPEAILNDLKRVTVCDPACGSGAYLLGMMQELLRLREGLFTCKARDYKRIYDRKLEIIQRNLYGVDKEPFAVNIAMLRLWLSLVVDNDAPVEDVVTGAVDVSLPNLKFKIQCGDALTAPMMNLNLFGDAYARDASRLRALEDEYFAPPQHGQPGRPKPEIESDIQAQQSKIADLIGSHADPGAVDWCVRFAEVFASSMPTTTIGGSLNMGQGELAEHPAQGGFSITLANPPYVRQELIRDQKPALKAVFPDVFNGTADLYTYFYARALQLLRPGGMLVFISSNKWFRAGYGANLRGYIADTCHVHSIIDFGDLPVFESATAYPMIFVAQKGKGEGAVVFTQVKSLDAPYPDVRALVDRDGSKLPLNSVKGPTWSVSSGNFSDRLNKIRGVGTSLGQYVKKQVLFGIKTGFNTAFYIDGLKRDQLMAEDPKSGEIIRHLAVGRDVKRWVVNFRDQWQIFTPIGVDMKRYPAVLRHLCQWQTELEKRTDKGNYFWELRACSYYSAFDGPKIIYPQIMVEPQFAYDETGAITNQKCFIITNVDKFLLGILNSKTIWQLIAEGSPGLRGGYSEPRRELMLSLPIPDANEDDRAVIAALVQKCLDAKGVECEAWEAEISERVAVLYGL